MQKKIIITLFFSIFVGSLGSQTLGSRLVFSSEGLVQNYVLATTHKHTANYSSKRHYTDFRLLLSSTSSKVPVLAEMTVEIPQAIQQQETKYKFKKNAIPPPPPPPVPSLTTQQNQKILGSPLLHAQSGQAKLNRVQKVHSVTQITALPDAPIYCKKLKGYLPKNAGSIVDKLSESTVDKVPEISYQTLLYFFQIIGRYVVLDTEATGLGKDHAITEIGCVEIENMQRTGNKFQAYINPEREVCSEAHKITGYTWRFLSKHTTFSIIAKNLLEFLQNSPLIIHNKHYDSKLLNEAYASLDPSWDRIETKVPIIDTQPFAKAILPDAKVGLRSLAAHYKLDETSIAGKHGALVDAELLVDVFLCLLKDNTAQLPKGKDVLWHLLPKTSIDTKFPLLNGSPLDSVFTNLGVTHPLPSGFRYAANMFHPELFDNFPAVIVKFVDSADNLKGVLVRYNFTKQPIRYFDPPDTKYTSKIFFGVADDATITIHKGSEHTIFIGNLITALIAREFLLGEYASVIKSYLDINDSFSIKSCLDLINLPSITFGVKTRRIIILLDSTALSESFQSKLLLQLIEKYCAPSSSGLLNKLKQHHQSLEGYVIQYEKQEWDVISDCVKHNSREMGLKGESGEKLMLTFNQDDKTMVINGKKIDQINGLLIGPPKSSIEVIQLSIDKNTEISLSKLAKEKPDVVAQKFFVAIPIRTSRDLANLDKVEQARNIYSEGSPIKNNSPVTQYFQKRGISFPLPLCFRWLSNIYHPWLNDHFPVTLVPLYNHKNIIIGVHRLFCDHDGSPLTNKIIQAPGSKNLPFKLSLGRTVRSAVEIYKNSLIKGSLLDEKEASVVIISEGVENALVARDTIVWVRQNEPRLATQMLKALKISGTFSIKACVGINGLIDIPFGKETHTIIVLVDNDGVNQEAKQTIINTVNQFLNFGRKVLIVLPYIPSCGKVDINDILMHNKNTPDYVRVVEFMCEAIEIHHIDELGHDNFVPLEENIRQLKEHRKRLSSSQTAFLTNPDEKTNTCLSLTLEVDNKPNPSKKTEVAPLSTNQPITLQSSQHTPPVLNLGTVLNKQKVPHQKLISKTLWEDALKLSRSHETTDAVLQQLLLDPVWNGNKQLSKFK